MWSLNNAGSGDGYNCWDDVDLSRELGRTTVLSFNNYSWDDIDLEGGCPKGDFNTGWELGCVGLEVVTVPSGVGTKTGSWDSCNRMIGRWDHPKWAWDTGELGLCWL